MNCILLPETRQTEIIDIETNTNNLSINNIDTIKHITHVLKAQVGDSLNIGQINGNLGTAIISDIQDNQQNKQIILTNIQLDIKPPKKLALTVILALPRPKVLRRLIMDMTSLGVKKIILVNSYRSQKSYWQTPMLKRLDEFVIEGLQQAVDTVPPIIELKKRFKPFVEDELKEELGDNGTGVVAHPYAGQSWADFLQQFIRKQPQQSTRQPPQQLMPNILCIGAEGGWIDYEIELLSVQGIEAVSLGRRILRTEAAVNVMIGSWLTHSTNITL